MMEKTWRWFGPDDPVRLETLRQIGVEGIVTALYDLPNGAVWTEEEILSLKRKIESAGLRWSVVESLPVSEAIKYGGPERDVLIEHYRQSLENLGRCGIRTVCYNFMPVIDWIRTDLEHPLPDGATTLYFDFVRFAYFDIHILERSGAAADYPAETLEKVEALSRVITPQERSGLIDTIITKTQGFISGNFDENDTEPVRKFRELLARYDGLSATDLRKNLQGFLEAVMPVCDRYGIDLCIHPDDPPMHRVFGLPRIATDEEDIDWILSCVDNPHNGLTFCAGTLSSAARNDVVRMARRFRNRTHFVHLRSCQLLPGGDFMEAPHTGGRADIPELVRIFEADPRRLPMRVDHGKLLPADREKGYPPGYSFLGRMLALGQVEGMMAALSRRR